MTYKEYYDKVFHERIKCIGKILFALIIGVLLLVRDMVPCIDPNNVVGLYDLVNNTFYSSPNGAAFVAGPAV